MKNLQSISILILIVLTISSYGFSQGNTFEPEGAAGNITLTGGANSAFGRQSSINLTTGERNTALGHSSLHFTTTGSENTAIGMESLYHNTEGGRNVAVGASALTQNRAGMNNTAVGYSAMNLNEHGANNTALGFYSLFNNRGGDYGGGDNNTALGTWTLHDNISGENNTATGMEALYSNESGTNNTSMGFRSMYENTEGEFNTAIGVNALRGNDSGNRNSSVGYLSLRTNISGNQNTGIGYFADVDEPNLENATAIGAHAKVLLSNRVRIGNESVERIGGQVGWTSGSDKSFKKNIKDSNLGLEFIKKLRPVTYNMKKGHQGILYTGFIAQEVEEVLKDLKVEFSGLCAPESKNDHYGIRYGNFVVPLVNTVKEQQEMIEDYQKEIAELDARLKKLEEALLKSKGFDGANSVPENAVTILAESAQLAQNQPNPFRNNTSISYQIPIETNAAEVLIFNAEGGLVFQKEIYEKGAGSFVFKADHLKAGSYFYSLVLDGVVNDTKHMIQIK